MHSNAQNYPHRPHVPEFNKGRGVNAKDILIIEHTVKQEIPVGTLFIDVELAKQPFLVGPDAFYSSANVINLVQSLDRVSIAKSDIKLKQVNYKVSSGIFSESSESSYRILIGCSLSQVENAVKVLESLKDVSIEDLYWEYDQADEVSEILVERSILEAKDQAQKRARLLSCKIVGVNHFETRVHRSTSPAIPDAFYSSKSKNSKIAKGLRGSWGAHLTLSASVHAVFLLAYVEDKEEPED